MLGAYVSTTTGNDSNPGTQAMPVQTIKVGIQHAMMIGTGASVYVAKGNYPEDVVVVEGISLYGGYDPVSWAHDPAMNDTAILSQGAAGVYADKTVTRKTTIDGFRLQGHDNTPVAHRGSAVTLDGATPILSNDVINGPAEGQGVDSHAVLILSPSNDPKGALITNSTITGGNAGTSTFGVAFRTNVGVPLAAPGAIAEITNNTITGGAGSFSYGIGCFEGGDGIRIYNNDVTTGIGLPGPGNEASGIAVAGNMLLGTVTIDTNRVNLKASNVPNCTPAGSPQAPWCNGIDSQGAKAVIVNNVVFGVNSHKSAGIWLRNAEGGVLNTLVLNSNYIDGGGVFASLLTQSAAVVITLNGGVAGTVGRIRNDILASGKGVNRFGVYEDSPMGKTCTFEKLENNDFFTHPGMGSDILYRSWNGNAGTNVTTIAAVNALNAPNASNSFASAPSVTATFHLNAGSPCIGKGTASEAPAKDFDGDPRPSGNGYDIGADEF